MAKRLDVKFFPVNNTAKLLCLFLKYPDKRMSIRDMKKEVKGTTAYRTCLNNLINKGIKFNAVTCRKKGTVRAVKRFKISSDKNVALATYFQININQK